MLCIKCKSDLPDGAKPKTKSSRLAAFCFGDLSRIRTPRTRQLRSAYVQWTEYSLGGKIVEFHFVFPPVN